MPGTSVIYTHTTLQWPLTFISCFFPSKFSHTHFLCPVWFSNLPVWSQSCRHTWAGQVTKVRRLMSQPICCGSLVLSSDWANQGPKQGSLHYLILDKSVFITVGELITILPITGIFLFSHHYLITLHFSFFQGIFFQQLN